MYKEPLVYALDHIGHLNVTENSFTLPKDFDAADFFSDFYGVSIFCDTKPCDVKINVGAYQANCLSTLPFHQSQVGTKRND